MDLPYEQDEFFYLLKLFFPNVYDIKYLMKSTKNLKGGLQEVAEQLEVCSLYLWIGSLLPNKQVKYIIVTCILIFDATINDRYDTKQQSIDLVKI